MCPEYKTDHSLVKMQLDFSEKKKGQGLWKLNTNHLLTTEYVKQINQAIDMSIDQCMEVDALVKWECVKENVITASKKFSTDLAMEKKTSN